ncbi:Coenzyme F420 hydrogenase/dehydrogenase, beta subunit C-terminal domain [Arthrobacter sp. B2a2-09]|uniref:Coenzyme F420 hydrogenase/dehydrogenase, beta subunit C-terminal domain n=1 Tax=Arthrobacter sp. B2a2-09 TaxID=2952822 RepID=UPI0022CD4F67|nr:Coenzyme F420 hydrogenase/dehydrogenase, beta subunit C-terminal domain [Arthrobacter sp. B2a2-09]MCZ9882313.1 Coenzyme F420 hydrogenase/dehydrogenase, beta subunit C-terminal domain [Arthrobacter sp. B2a2-09]
MPRFDRTVESVVRSGNCSGCGACALIDPGLSLVLDDDGFNRPVRRLPLSPKNDRQMTDELLASCPGIVVKRPMPDQISGEETRFEPALGHAVSSWQAWATDPETRFRGSSGGVLTALAEWLVDSGRSARVIGAAADASEPRRTVAVQLGRNSDFLQQAGSRYAPVSVAAQGSSLSPDSAFVGKPCEVAAVRQLSEYRGDEERPLLMSFFCAGVPSQLATDRLLSELGIPVGSPLRTLRYRGHGWPGEFYAETVDGAQGSATYDESWGKQLGPSMQWRCKICPDGVGESADIVAGDYWKTDDRGYPEFTDGSGVSALIARTTRGHEAIVAAVDAGVIQADPLDLRQISSIQPYQVERRATLWARLLGRRLAGWKIPRYVGFQLLELAFERPLRSARYMYGSFRRSWVERFRR